MRYDAYSLTKANGKGKWWKASIPRTTNAIRPEPWQTETCIGDWHYSRANYEESRYKTVPRIVSKLTDM